jgi:mannose-6-phosphate isomerase-like protein (cupin superfamily)
MREERCILQTLAMPAQTDPPLPIVHLVQILIRHQRGDQVVFLLHPHETWRPAEGGDSFLVLPTKKIIGDIAEPFRRGTSIEHFVDGVMRGDLGFAEDDYAIEEEISAAEETIPAVHSGVVKHFVVFPVEVWVAPGRRRALCEQLCGVWLTPGEAIAHPRISPTARAVMEHILQREADLARRYSEKPADEAKDETPNRLLLRVSDRPSMYALASKWFAKNKGGVRHLPARVIDEVLAAGDRAFNLRVADPYLRYQRQGVGFTWSFFTHKDAQDIHVHSAPTVEIYGVIEGALEIWWKPYHDQGTSAWSRQLLGPGDWIEVEALHCHVVRWHGEGKGVVFKAGPGPLAGVGRLGVSGKTKCDECICMKPQEVCALAKR